MKGVIIYFRELISCKYPKVNYMNDSGIISLVFERGLILTKRKGVSGC